VLELDVGGTRPAQPLALPEQVTDLSGLVAAGPSSSTRTSRLARSRTKEGVPNLSAAGSANSVAVGLDQSSLRSGPTRSAAAAQVNGAPLHRRCQGWCTCTTRSWKWSRIGTMLCARNWLVPHGCSTSTTGPASAAGTTGRASPESATAIGVRHHYPRWHGAGVGDVGLALRRSGRSPTRAAIEARYLGPVARGESTGPIDAAGRPCDRGSTTLRRRWRDRVGCSQSSRTAGWAAHETRLEARTRVRSS
jgi:hypothetical protein